MRVFVKSNELHIIRSAWSRVGFGVIFIWLCPILDERGADTFAKWRDEVSKRQVDLLDIEEAAAMDIDFLMHHAEPKCQKDIRDNILDLLPDGKSKNPLPREVWDALMD